jgi:hypothetical protein
MHVFFGWLLLFIPLVALSPRRLSLLEWSWFLGFGWLALSGLRYVIWFMFIMALSSGPLLTELSRPFTREIPVNSNPRFNFLLSGMLLVFPLLLLPGLRESWWEDSPPAYHEATTPIAATFLCRLHLRQLSDLRAAFASVVDRQPLQRLPTRALGEVSEDRFRQARMG